MVTMLGWFGGRGPGLGAEALQLFLVADRCGRQHLEGNLPFEPGVLGEVDLAHGAATDMFEHPVVCQHLADHRCSGSAGHESKVSSSRRRSVFRRLLSAHTAAAAASTNRMTRAPVAIR